MKDIAAHFIKVDLDLKSTASLQPLLEAWTDRVGRFHTPDKDGRKHRVRLEWVLSRKVIEAAHEVGAHVRMTVYSPLPLMQEEQRPGRKKPPAIGAASRITRVSVSAKKVRVYMADGLMVVLPISSSQRLSNATIAQRTNWQLLDGGRRIYWPDVDDTMGVEEVLDGIPGR